MSTIPHHAEAGRIEDEAALWAARLRGGGITDADRALLAVWLEHNPEHRWVLSRYRELSGDLDRQYGDGVGPLVLRGRRQRWGAAGTILAVAAAVAVLFFVLGRGRHEFATKTAERHVAVLEDGSRIELNAQTKLTVAFSRDERHVRLAHGEALFSVAKDPARLFVVETPAGVVRVTGTVFNVRAARDTFDNPGARGKMEVTVLEGHVSVRPAAAADDVSVPRGRQAVLAGEQIALRTLAETTLQDVVAWRNGYAVFDDTPLREAMERFATYHARTMTVAPEVANLRLGGRYSLNDLEGALDAIAKTLPVRVDRGAAGAVKIGAAAAR